MKFGRKNWIRHFVYPTRTCKFSSETMGFASLNRQRQLIQNRISNAAQLFELNQLDRLNLAIANASMLPICLANMKLVSHSPTDARKRKCTPKQNKNALHTFWNARSQIKSWIEAMHRYVIQHMLNKFQFIIDFQVRPGYVQRCNCNTIYTIRTQCAYCVHHAQCQLRIFVRASIAK